MQDEQRADAIRSDVPVERFPADERTPPARRAEDESAAGDARVAAGARQFKRRIDCSSDSSAPSWSGSRFR